MTSPCARGGTPDRWDHPRQTRSWSARRGRYPWSCADPARIKLEPSFSAIGKEPWLIIIMLVCVLIAHIFLEYTKHGRFIYAMGGNKQAAKLSGINVKAYRYLAGSHFAGPGC